MIDRLTDVQAAGGRKVCRHPPTYSPTYLGEEHGRGEDDEGVDQLAIRPVGNIDEGG